MTLAIQIYVGQGRNIRGRKGTYKSDHTARKTSPIH